MTHMIPPPPPDTIADTDPAPTNPETPAALEHDGTPASLIPFVRAVHRVEDAIESERRATADALDDMRREVLRLWRGHDDRLTRIEAVLGLHRG